MNKKFAIAILAVLLSAVGVVLLLATDCAVIGDSENATTIAGAHMVFGWPEDTILGTVKTLELSIIGVLAVVAAAGGILLALLGTKNSIMSMLSGILFVASAVLIFLLPSNLVFSETIPGVALSLVKDSIKGSVTLYISLALEALAGLFVILGAFVSGGKKRKRR